MLTWIDNWIIPLDRTTLRATVAIAAPLASLAALYALAYAQLLHFATL